MVGVSFDIVITVFTFLVLLVLFVGIQTIASGL